MKIKDMVSIFMMAELEMELVEELTKVLKKMLMVSQ